MCFALTDLDLHQDPAGAHCFVNASRVTTFLRGGVEQLHGALKGAYKVNQKSDIFPPGTKSLTKIDAVAESAAVEYKKCVFRCIALALAVILRRV